MTTYIFHMHVNLHARSELSDSNDIDADTAVLKANLESGYIPAAAIRLNHVLSLMHGVLYRAIYSAANHTIQPDAHACRQIEI